MVSSSSESMSTFSKTGQTNMPPPLTTRKPRMLHRAVGVRIAVFAAGDDEHLVWADLGVAAGPDAREDEEDEQIATALAMMVIQGKSPAMKDQMRIHGDGIVGLMMLRWVPAARKTGCPRCA